MSATAIRDWVRQHIARLLEVPVEEIDGEAPIERFGLGSRDTAEIVVELQNWLSVQLPASLLYEHENIDSLAAAVARVCTPRQ